MATETLFLVVFDPCSSIVKSIFDCRLSGVHKANQIHDFLEVYGHIFTMI